MRMHFITGLPRSGSTLLASILRQNPKFEASIQSPVGRVFTDVVTALGVSNESSLFLNDTKREAILRGIVGGYYYDLPIDVKVVFDNNRRWTANASALAKLWPECKLLCCVRAPVAIVDSFERLAQNSPLSASAIVGGVGNTTVYERVHELMKAQGVVGFSLNALRSAFFGPERDRLLIINYDDLCRFPAAVVKDIYEALGEEPFNHDFGNISPIPGAAEFDSELAAPGLHDLKPAVVYEPRTTILPPDIWKSLPAPFWGLNGSETSPS